MNRAAHFVIFSLIAIALIMILQAALIRSPLQPLSRGAESTENPPVERYYDAIDRFLAGGDERTMRDVIGSGFQSWTSSDPAPADANDFIDQLATLRALFPGLILQHTLLVAGETQVTVQLNVPAGRLPFLGMAISPQALLGDFEILRFERGRLAERWSFPSLAGSFGMLTPEAIGAPRTALLSRVTVDENEDRGVTLGPTVAALIVERGSIRLNIEGASGEGAYLLPSGDQKLLAAPTRLDLPSGSLIRLPPGASAHVSASSGETSTIVSMSLQTADITQYIPEPHSLLPVGKQIEPQGQATLRGMQSTLQMGWVHLRTGSRFSLDHTSREMLLLVEGGTLHVESPDGSLIELREGQAIWTTPGLELTFRVSSPGDASLVLLTVTGV